MSSWSDDDRRGSGAMERYTPKDLTNVKDFSKEIRSIDGNQNLTVVDKYKYKRNLMRAVFQAKQQEINHHLDSYENYLRARKDVEAKTITLEAQKAIMTIEQDQLQMMKDIGLSNTDEISKTLIRAGEMLTDKLIEVEESHMADEIKQLTLKNIRKVWDKTNNRILDSVDTYMDELYERDKGRMG